MTARLRTEDHKLNRSVGLLLKSIRLTVGLSQTDLANRIGTQQSAISDLENGKGATVWFLRRVVRGLGFDLKLTIERRGRYELET